MSTISNGAGVVSVSLQYLQYTDVPSQPSDTVVVDLLLMQRGWHDVHVVALLTLTGVTAADGMPQQQHVM